MKNKTFIDNKYGNVFTVGQKVRCTYYHEHISDVVQKRAYKRKWYEYLDKQFTPVKLGKIVGSAGVHPYWLAGANNDWKQEYLYVKFKEYLFPKAIPITCIEGVKEYVEKMKRIYGESEHLIGQEGYDIESANKINNWIKDAETYIEK